MKQQLKTTIRQALGISALAALLPLSQSALAQAEGWSQMQEQIVSVEALLEADFHNGLNPIGSVDQVVLNEDGTALEYIIYDVPYPYSFYGSENGFTTIEGVTFHQGLTDLTVRMDDDTEPNAPEELTLTRSEADHRLVSNLLGEPMTFEDGETRVVQDILVDRETGEVAFYVIEMQADSLFSNDRRTIPGDMVSIENDGSMVASTDIRGVDDITQQYDEAYL